MCYVVRFCKALPAIAVGHAHQRGARSRSVSFPRHGLFPCRLHPPIPSPPPQKKTKFRPSAWRGLTAVAPAVPSLSLIPQRPASASAISLYTSSTSHLLPQLRQRTHRLVPCPSLLPLQQAEAGTAACVFVRVQGGGGGATRQGSTCTQAVNHHHLCCLRRFETGQDARVPHISMCVRISSTQKCSSAPQHSMSPHKPAVSPVHCTPASGAHAAHAHASLRAPIGQIQAAGQWDNAATATRHYYYYYYASSQVVAGEMRNARHAGLPAKHNQQQLMLLPTPTLTTSRTCPCRAAPCPSNRRCGCRTGRTHSRW